MAILTFSIKAYDVIREQPLTRLFLPSLAFLYWAGVLCACAACAGRMVASLSNQLTQSSQPNATPAAPEPGGGAESGAPASQGVDTALAVQAVRKSSLVFRRFCPS